MNLPKIKKRRAFSCFFLKCWQCKRAWKTLHQHWLHFYCWQIQNGYVILIIHQQLATGCKLQVWGFWGVFIWFVCICWLVGFFNRTMQKKTSISMLTLQTGPPTSETGNESPTNSLFEKSKLKSFRKDIPNPLHRGFLLQTGRIKLLWKDSVGSYFGIYQFLKILRLYSS